MPVGSAASARASAGSMPPHLPPRAPRRKLGPEEATTAGGASSRRGRELVETAHVARGPTPEEAALGLEERQRIWRVYRRLSPRQQEVFALRQLEGWSTDEVAETLGLSSGSVKRHLFRATHQLRAALKGTP